MRDYPSGAGQSKSSVTVHVPSSRWSLAARLEQAWWRNPNARGIAEPDPRTVTRGRRAARALKSPCPWSRRRAERERKLYAARAQAGPLLAQLAALLNVWPDRELVAELMRRLTAAEAGAQWLLTDPTWRTRTYERKTPLYLPRRADRDATRFLRAFRDARRFVGFADRMLVRERDDRLRLLAGALRPSSTHGPQRLGTILAGLGAALAADAPPREEPITRRPHERRDIDPHPQPRGNAQGWKEVADRIAARLFAERPRDAM